MYEYIIIGVAIVILKIIIISLLCYRRAAVRHIAIIRNGQTVPVQANPLHAGYDQPTRGQGIQHSYGRVASPHSGQPMPSNGPFGQSMQPFNQSLRPGGQFMTPGGQSMTPNGQYMQFVDQPALPRGPEMLPEEYKQQAIDQSVDTAFTPPEKAQKKAPTNDDGLLPL